MKQAFHILTFLVLASFVSELAHDITFALKYEYVDTTESVDDNTSQGSQEGENEEESNVTEKEDACLLPMTAHLLHKSLIINISVPDFRYTNCTLSSRYMAIPELPPETI